MQRYVNTGNGAIQTMEVTGMVDGLQACVSLRKESDIQPVSKVLSELGYATLSHTTVGGKPMLVVSGPRDEAAFIRQLSKIDTPLVAQAEKKPFDAWKVRSILGFGGQTLQLIASLMKHKVDGPLLLFASTNLTANGINLAYKAQKQDDPHQLMLIKKTINEKLASQVEPGKQLLDVRESRALLRESNRPKTQAPFDSFMRKHSVSVGELGLRYVGAFGMAFPASDWGKALKESRLPMTNKAAPLRTVAGIGSIIGKTLATTSKIPDPYNPEPRGWLDKIREKYSFLAGGLVEAAAFSTLTYDAIANSAPVMRNGVLDTSRSLKIGGKYHRDWISGVGSAMFVAGYIVRSWAKFGERLVNMPEVYAHASDTLALLPPERIPQALADTTAYLAEHFKGKPGMSFGAIYDKISDDLCCEHHITITEIEKAKTLAPETPAMKPEAPVVAIQEHPSHHIHSAQAKHIATVHDLHPPKSLSA